MTETKVAYITPDDASWALPDDERLAVERDATYPPDTDDWFFICYDGEVVFTLHKEEIVELYKFATRDDDAD